MQKKCFVISPIGDDGTPIRRHADELFEFIIQPALAVCDIEAVRSDHVQQPGKISDQMFRAIFEYDLCIAVLTGRNPNVYYELAVAQAANRPVIILIEKSETLPFDIKDFRVLPYDLSLTSNKEQTHVRNLVAFIRAFEQAGWQAVDIFLPYRRQTSLPALPEAHSLGVKIQRPGSGAVVGKVDVAGTLERLPPPGYELRSLRYYPAEHGFIPHGKIAVDTIQKTWAVVGFDVGGDPGDRRGIAIALAGSDASILLDYWEAAHAVHRQALRIIQDRTGGLAGARWLPPIPKWPLDLIVCARVDVVRAGDPVTATVPG